MAKKEDKKFIEDQIPVQDRPNTAFQSTGVSGGFRGFPKPLKPTKSFLQKQAAKQKLKREVESAQLSMQLARFGKKKTIKTTPITKSAKRRQEKKLKTSKDSDFFPKVKESFFGKQTINEQVKNATVNFPNPTGVNLKNKLAVVGDTVITTTTAGTIVAINPDILPKKDLDKIQVLPDEKDELQIQKVIEQQQTLTPEEVSDLAVKTKPTRKPLITPTIEPKIDLPQPEPKTEPTKPVSAPSETEETLIGTQDDVELDEPELDEVELTDPDTEITPVPVVNPDVIQEPNNQDLATEVPAPAPDFAPLDDPVQEQLPTPTSQEDVVPQTETLTQPETLTETDLANNDFGTVANKPKAIPVVVPKKPKSTKQPVKQKKAPTKKKKTSKNQFMVKNGLKPTVTNFKTKKSSFQSNNVTGDIFKAPKGTEFDTNAGFREDSFKAIKFADKKLKFKNRKDVLVAAEKKGLI